MVSGLHGLSVMTVAIALLWVPTTYGFSYRDMDLSLRPHITETFDDNITFLEDSEKEDFITELGLEMHIARETRTQHLSLMGELVESLFAENSDFNNLAARIELDYQKALSKHDEFGLANKFVRTEKPHDFDEAFGRSSGRYTYYSNQLSLNYSRTVSKQFELNAAYDYEIDNFSGVTIKDSMLHRGRFNADYQLSSAVKTGLAYEFLIRDFQAGDSGKAHSIYGEFDYDFTKQFSFEGQAGTDVLHRFGGGVIVRPAIDASLIYDTDKKTRVRLTFSKKHTSTPYREEFFNQWRLSAAVTRDLLDRLKKSPIHVLRSG